MKKDVLRSDKVIKPYRAKRKKLGKKLESFDLRTLPIVEKWDHWVVVKNEFPYDNIAQRHDLLVPRKDIKDDRFMTHEMRQELFVIKDNFGITKRYDAIFENMNHNRSVPTQYHLHCIKFKYVTPLAGLS